MAGRGHRRLVARTTGAMGELVVYIAIHGTQAGRHRPGAIRASGNGRAGDGFWASLERIHSKAFSRRRKARVWIGGCGDAAMAFEPDRLPKGLFNCPVRLPGWQLGRSCAESIGKPGWGHDVFRRVTANVPFIGRRAAFDV